MRFEIAVKKEREEENRKRRKRKKTITNNGKKDCKILSFSIYNRIDDCRKEHLEQYMTRM